MKMSLNKGNNELLGSYIWHIGLQMSDFVQMLLFLFQAEILPTTCAEIFFIL